MKKISQSLVTTLTILLISLLTSCSTEMKFGISQVVPTATGSVKIKEDDNTNTSIKIKVQHLASPERLTPPKKEYVVWMETERNGTKNLGRLETSSGLSGDISGSLSTTTPFAPLHFIITAEDSPTPEYPGSVIVLSTKNVTN